jgi:uncharacterized membrane protein YfcA
MPTPLLLSIGLAMVFLAGLIRGFTGFGFLVAAVPMLSLIMPPAQAVPIALLLQLLVSLNGLRQAARICDWRSVRLLTVGAAFATPIGVLALAHLPASPVRLCIAAIVLLAVGVLGRGLRLKAPPGRRGIVSAGVLAGLFNGLAGMPGPPVIAFYLAAPISIDVARASMIVFFLASSILALLPLAVLDMLSWPMAAGALAGFPPVILGSAMGAHLYGRSHEGGYRLVALSLLVATALLAAIRAALDVFA